MGLWPGGYKLGRGGLEQVLDILIDMSEFVIMVYWNTLKTVLNAVRVHITSSLVKNDRHDNHGWLSWRWIPRQVLLHIQSKHVSACLPVIIALIAVIQIFCVPYLQFLTYTHGQRNRKIMKPQLRWLWGKSRKPVHGVSMAQDTYSKRSLICWQNPLLQRVSNKYSEVWSCEECAAPFRPILRIAYSAIHIPGAVHQFEGDHMTSFRDRKSPVWTVAGAKTNGWCIYFYPVNWKKTQQAN